MLVRGARIASVGQYVALDAEVGAETMRVDYRPYEIRPGMIDAHCHIAQLGYLAAATDVGPAVTREIAGIQQQLAGANTDPAGWIVGRGYVGYTLRERRSPTRDDLDQAVRDVPCVIYHASLHECVLNSVGLRELGLGDDREDPPGGRYGRDPDGRLDGRLIEAPMFALFASAISARLAQGGGDLVATATDHLASLGITSCVDANTTADELAALADAVRSGRLSVRVGSLCRFGDLELLGGAQALRGVPSERLSIVGAKVFADGGMTNRTAAVDPPYERPTGEAGLLLLDAIQVAGAARRCQELGLGLAVHAQGERAIEAAIDGFRDAGGGDRILRRIEHGGAFTPALQRAAAGLGITVVSQPGFLSAFGDGFLEAFGARRAAYLYPFRSLLEHDIPVAFSSDAPVITASPWIGIRDAQLRRSSTGTVIGDGQQLAANEAIAAYTATAARSGATAEGVGVLAPGHPADFVVVDEILADAQNRARDVTVRATFMAHTARYTAAATIAGAGS
jgi:predicted amidohydrolase YtcJ